MNVIFRAHLLGLVRDGRVLFGVVFLWSLVAMGAASAGHRMFAERTSAQASRDAMRSFWLEQGSANPHSAAHFGVYAFRGPDPLAALDPGLHEVIGSTVFLEAHKQNGLLLSRARDATVLDRFAVPSPSGVLVLLVPLLALILSHDAYAGRSADEDRWLSAAGASRAARTAGPAGAVVFAVLASVAGAVGTAIVGVLVLDPVVGSDPGRVAVWGLAHLLHAVAWTGIGLAVSAVADSRRSAMITVIVLWLVGTLALPRLGATVASWVSPVPSGGGFALDVERALASGPDGHAPSGARVEHEKERLLTLHGVTTVDELPLNFDGVSMQIAEDVANDVFDDRFGELYTAAESQLGAHRWFALVSPAVAVGHASIAACGTGLDPHVRFVGTAEAYRRDLVRTMNAALATGSRTGDWDYEVGREVWETVPAYAPPSVDRPAAFRGAALPLGALGGWTIGSFLVAGAFAWRRASS